MLTNLAEAELRQHEQRRAAYEERHAPERAEARRVMGELAWRKRAAARAVEILRPQYVRDTLGQCPRSGRARREWHRAAGQIEEYRERYGITDTKDALGLEQGDFKQQQQEWRGARQAAAKLQERQHGREPERGLTRERTRELAR